jgi:lysophospholipase L1-like esterase
MALYRLIALGDSLTYGYPFGKAMSWVHYTEQALGVPILNQGVNGDTFREMLYRLNRDVLDLQPQWCIVSGGANDVYQGMDPKLMEANFKKILSRLKESKVRVVVGLPAPVEDAVYEKELAKFRRWLKKTAKDLSLKTIDFYAAFIDPKKKKLIPSYFEDGVHPSSKGYQAMAREAIKALKPLLGID